MLVLFTCQSVLAGIDEHVQWSSVDGIETSHHAAVTDTPAQPDSDHGHTGAPSLVDSDCCHAHGHCHLLAFMGDPPDVSIPYVPGNAAPPICSYHSLYTDTLLRPPARA